MGIKPFINIIIDEKGSYKLTSNIEDKAATIEVLTVVIRDIAFNAIPKQERSIIETPVNLITA